mgnify:CR=1 FL=1
MKKIPMRTCIVTGEKLEKKELIRVVRDKEGHVFIDDIGKSNGRGAYLKKDVEVIKKAEKSKILNKKLEIEVPSSIYSELISKVGA